VLYSCDLRQGTVLLHAEHLGFLALSKGLTNHQFAIQMDVTAAIRRARTSAQQSSHYGSNNRDHTHDHSIIACSHHLYMGAILCPHPIVVNHAFNVKPRSGNKTIHCKIFAQTGFLLKKVQS